MIAGLPRPVVTGTYSAVTVQQADTAVCPGCGRDAQFRSVNTHGATRTHVDCDCRRPA